VLNDLDFEVRDVAFETKVFNRYGTFDQIAIKSMEDHGYAYLHRDLLEKGSCHDHSLGFVTKAKAWKNVGRKSNLEVTFTLLGMQRSVKE
jgi:hypothetical protein